MEITMENISFQELEGYIHLGHKGLSRICEGGWNNCSNYCKGHIERENLKDRLCLRFVHADYTQTMFFLAWILFYSNCIAECFAASQHLRRPFVIRSS